VIQLHVVLEWAAREGGTPGLDDAECFYATVPDVLLMGYMGREPIAVISAFPAGYHALRGTVPGNGLSNDSQPMSYTIGTAARATGKAKSTISRDVKSGRISAQRQPDGSYLIDPSELHRVYPPVVFDNGSENTESNDSQPLTTDAETALLRQDNMRLLEQIEMLRDERDDLRRRLDTEAEERRRLTLIVTDQRVKRRGWWPWVS
jgi:hypothetical protein